MGFKFNIRFFRFLKFGPTVFKNSLFTIPTSSNKKKPPTRTCDLFRLSVFKIRCTASDLTTFWSVLRKKEQTRGVRWAEGLFKNFQISPPLLLLLVMMVVVGDAPTCSLSETQKPNPKKARSWTNLTPPPLWRSGRCSGITREGSGHAGECAFDKLVKQILKFSGPWIIRLKTVLPFRFSLSVWVSGYVCVCDVGGTEFMCIYLVGTKIWSPDKLWGSTWVATQLVGGNTRQDNYIEYRDH